MDDFDAEIAENLAATEAVVEQGDRTYVEAVADMFDRLANCPHQAVYVERLPGGIAVMTCFDCGATRSNGGRWL